MPARVAQDIRGQPVRGHAIPLHGYNQASGCFRRSGHAREHNPGYARFQTTLRENT